MVPLTASHQTHTRYSEDGGVTTGPAPSYAAPPLRVEADVVRLPNKGYGTGPQLTYLNAMIQDKGLVDLLGDFSRVTFRALLNTHPNATYPSFYFRQLALYNTFVVKTHGRRAFKLNVRPLKTCISDSIHDLMEGTGNFTKRVRRTRPTVWCAPVAGAHPQRSGEIICVARITVSTLARPLEYFWYDIVYIQWHVPARGFLEEDVAELKPDRVVKDFQERPGPVDATETAAQRSLREFAHCLLYGSRALAGGDVAVPVTAYHPRIPCDVVALGKVRSFVTPSAIIGRADMVPCYRPDLYGTVQGDLDNVQRPPMLRMWPRA